VADIAPAASKTSDRHGYHLEILLVSLSGLLLEISYTRVVSFKLFYYYTYFVLGLALLGIGSGGVFVATSRRLRAAATAKIVTVGCTVGAFTVALGYGVVARMPIATREIWAYGSRASYENLARLLVICLAIFLSFLAIGVVVSTVLSRHVDAVGRLYFADLAGAAIACAIVVSIVSWRGAPATIFLAAAVLAVTAVLAAVRHGTASVIPGITAVLMLALVLAPGLAGGLRLDKLKDELQHAHPVFSSWSPIFRVDALELTDRMLLYHDGLSGSAIYPFDGDAAALDRFDADIRSLPFSVRDETVDDVLIVGAAGGNEILASLHFGAKHIDAVELNPVTHSLVTGRYRDYTGGIGHRDDVNYVVGDGRSFLARSDDRYDLVWFPAPDSYAATNAANASAFVLSESYLYTVEAIEDSLARLGDDGLLVAQFGEVDYAGKPNRTSRYVSTARAALKELGIDDPSGHVLLATSPIDFGAAATSSTIIVRKRPFTAEEVERFRSHLAEVPGGVLRHGAGVSPDEPDQVSRILTTPGPELRRLYDRAPYDVDAVTDDGPFFWHFVGFPDVVRGAAEPIERADLEAGVGERVLLLLLVVAVVLAALFLLLPFVAVRETWRRFPRKGTSAAYFAALGLGFMFFEITMIQRLTLFLGYPTYSLTVTLASILVFAGLGSLLSDRLRTTPARTALLAFGALAALTVLYLFGLPAVTASLLHLPLLARVVVTVLVLAPLGLCLGMFMPLGLAAVSRLTSDSREYVAWGWAVNGFASVVGATLTTIIAMTVGFRVVLVLALAAYLVAVLALRALEGAATPSSA
jgi:hypothetical protein